MLFQEFDRAVQDAEVDFQKVVTKQTPFVSRTLWITWAMLRYGKSNVYEVASVFYSSDALDNVPGINGANRHRVFVDWIGRHTETFGNALEVIDEAKRKAHDTALQVLTARLNSPRKA